MIRRLATALGLAALLAAPAAAQVPVLDIRLGAQAVMPQGDLSDLYKGGFGAYGRLGLPVGPIKLMGTATWTRLPGKTVDILGTPVGIEDQDVIGLTAGPHFSFPFVDAGLEVGYFSNFEKVGFVPSVSVGLLNFDVMASYTIVNSDPKANWLGLGVGFRF
ncbi:MAG: hypothetical protein K1X31_12485 [Gemmatimonadaceae bacterium]|nr:hypothetical protein [Gemmatimonadaceae bacterium]